MSRGCERKVGEIGSERGWKVVGEGGVRNIGEWGRG